MLAPPSHDSTEEGEPNATAGPESGNGKKGCDTKNRRVFFVMYQTQSKLIRRNTCTIIITKWKIQNLK